MFTGLKRMICSRKPSRHKPSKKPPNLRKQTIVRATSLGSRPSTAPKSRLAATASGQRLPGLSRNARLASSSQGRNRGTAEAVPAAANNLGQALSPSPLSSLLVPRSRHLGGYQPPQQTSPHCHAGQIANAIWKSLRPSHRRGFRLASTCGTLPLSRISNTWLTAAAVLTTHAPQHQAPGAYPRPRESFPL